MELKTLKDLEDYKCITCGKFFCINMADKLRQEAIKWYKYWMSEFSRQGGDETCLGRATSFKDFFNLTEADLTKLKGGIIDNE